MKARSCHQVAGVLDGYLGEAEGAALVVLAAVRSVAGVGSDVMPGGAAGLRRPGGPSLYGIQGEPDANLAGSESAGHRAFHEVGGAWAVLGQIRPFGPWSDPGNIRHITLSL